MKILFFIFDYIYAIYVKIVSTLHSTPKHSLDLKKPTIIFIPGVYENWFYFRHLARELRKTHNIIYSDALFRSKSISEDSQTIADYIYKNNLDNVTLISHSSGGLTAIKCMVLNRDILKTIAIAAPFSGVLNGHLVRTKKVQELLPNSPEINYIHATNKDVYKKIVSIYPAYDNQVWSTKGSALPNAQNIKLSAQGHHLILKSSKLIHAVRNLMD